MNAINVDPKRGESSAVDSIRAVVGHGELADVGAHRLFRCAHLGGLFAGFALGAINSSRNRRGYRGVHSLLVDLVVVVVFVVVLLRVFGGLLFLLFLGRVVRGLFLLGLLVVVIFVLGFLHFNLVERDQDRIETVELSVGRQLALGRLAGRLDDGGPLGLEIVSGDANESRADIDLLIGGRLGMTWARIAPWATDAMRDSSAVFTS